MNDDKCGGFRAFALALYARPGAAPACLRLQDEGGWDVALLLYGLWRASEGAAIGPEEARAAAALSAEWAARVVRPLRAIRRAMKAAPFTAAPPDAAEAARDKVKALELDMELREIAFLEGLAARCAPAPGAAEAARNLSALAAASGAALIEEPVRALTSPR